MIVEPRLTGKFSATRQRYFVAAMLLLGLLVSIVVVRYIDPPVSTNSAGGRNQAPGVEVNRQ